MEAVRCEGLSFRYNTAEKAALTDVSFTVKQGELVMLMGGSGCGKTTLLRLLKPEISPLGEKMGGIFLFGDDIGDRQPGVGYVHQHPEEGFVSDTVRGEIMFAAENAGLAPEEVRRLTAETVSRFGLGRLLHRRLSELSGGEKQLVSLCAAMVTQPDLLLLDEPFSRLDPNAAESFGSLLLRLNRELGVTVVVAEHSSEILFAECDQILLMDKGSLAAAAPPRRAAHTRGFLDFMPAAAQVFADKDPTPLSVREGRETLSRLPHRSEVPLPESQAFEEELLSADGLRFSFTPDGEDILAGADISLHRGELLALVGANGSGKTTLLRCLAGLARPYSGSVRAGGKPLKRSAAVIGMLPQETADLFLQPTVIEDYRFALKAMGRPEREAEELLDRIGCGQLAQMHPYDLSGGELQRCGLGRVLLCDPDILLLDEPTKGLDPVSAHLMGELLRRLCAEGKGVLVVTHSLGFAARFAHTCGIFCGGRVESLTPAPEFFAKAGFYSTAAGRISRGMVKNAYTAGLLRSALGGAP